MSSYPDTLLLIDNEWREAKGNRRIDVVNPATGATIGHLADFGACRGIDHINTSISFGFAPFVVYQQESVGITAHECSKGNVAINCADSLRPKNHHGLSGVTIDQKDGRQATIV